MDLSVLFTAGIFLISFLALLLTGFGYMIKPIIKRIDKLEIRMDSIESKLDRLLAKQ